MTLEQQLTAERAANQELNRLLRERDAEIAKLKRDWSRDAESYREKLTRIIEVAKGEDE